VLDHLPKQIKRLVAFLLLWAVSLLAWSFLPSPGAEDVRYWLAWLQAVDSRGIVPAYKTIEWLDYPPLIFLIFFGVAKLATLFQIQLFLGLKLSLFAFLIITTLVFLAWTRNLWLATLLQLALLLNAMALVYVDIYFAPTLLLSLWALKARKLCLFTLVFSTTCLIKWQPVILAPFILVYLLEDQPTERHPTRMEEGQDQPAERHPTRMEEGQDQPAEPFPTDLFYKKLLKLFWQVVLPLWVIVGVVWAIFGWEFWMAFRRAVSDPILSGKALNFNWVLTHLLHLNYPNIFGGLVEGRATIIQSDLRILLIPKLLFYPVYGLVVSAFLKQAKTFENLLLYALAGYLAYFTFNTGVHQNHLFLALILAALLAWLKREHLFTFIICGVVANLNLFVFYGLDGTEPPRLEIAGLDLAFCLALLNVWLFVLFFTVVFLKEPNP